MTGTAVTAADRWDSDLADLLGLDVTRADAFSPAGRRRTTRLLFGAVAAAGLLSVGVAFQHRSKGTDGERSSVRIVASGSSDTAMSSEAPLLVSRPNAEQSVGPSSIRPPAEGAPVPAPQAPSVPGAAAARSGQLTLPSLAQIERTVAREGASGARSDGALPAIMAALSAAVPTAATTSSVGSGDNRPVERERGGTAENATVPSLAVPLDLLVPTPARAARRSGFPAFPAEEAVTVRGRSKADRKIEALDALRSLRRQ